MLASRAMVKGVSREASLKRECELANAPETPYHCSPSNNSGAARGPPRPRDCSLHDDGKEGVCEGAAKATESVDSPLLIPYHSCPAQRCLGSRSSPLQRGWLLRQEIVKHLTPALRVRKLAGRARVNARRIF